MPQKLAWRTISKQKETVMGNKQKGTVMYNEKDKAKVDFTRRHFLKATGAAVALAGVSTAGLALGTTTANAAGLPERWDDSADVVIIGSGFAGLAAALEAHMAGSSVIILEKMMTPGGNSIINGGAIAAADTPQQAQAGIKDSPELMYKDMLKAGLGINHPELARIMTEKSKETVAWTIDYLGVQYEDHLAPSGGQSVRRTFHTLNWSGGDIIRPMLAKLKGMGVKVRTKSLVEQIIKDDDGRVKGLKILAGYRYPKADSGKTQYIKARRAVILATGGFANDVAFRSAQDPRLTADVAVTNQPGATASGLIPALEIGTNPVHLSWIQLGPWGTPDEKGMGVGYRFPLTAAWPYGVMVDPATGKRFINELGDRKQRADAILARGHYCIGIADSKGTKYTNDLPKMLEKNVVKQFDTIEALAAHYEINLTGLKETIQNYNEYVKNGKDTEFGKPIRKGAVPIENAPFYGIRMWPKIHHCMGGVEINGNTQVIDLHQKPIKGFYAAGEATGGVHGASRLGSCATTDCLTFGRIAGKNAAAETPWS